MTEPIELSLDGTVMQAIHAVLAADMARGGTMRVALGAFFEGRGVPANDQERWAIAFTGAMLVPEPIPDGLSAPPKTAIDGPSQSVLVEEL